MSDYIVQDTQLTTVADAIRAKGGTSEPLVFPEGFVSAVEGISAGGGEYTSLNCVTIINDDTYGRHNGFFVNIPLASIARVEARLKFPDTEHCIWLASASYGGVSNTSQQPFIDKTSAFAGQNVSSSEVIEVSADVGGVVSFSANCILMGERRIKVGCWTDATYSQTFSLYGLKLFGAEEELLCDLKPALSKNNIPGFYDDVSGIFYDNLAGYPFAAGEAI